MAELSYFDQISNQIQTGNEPFKWYRNRIKELGTPSVPELLRTGKLNNTPVGSGEPQLTEFDLDNIDGMRMDILEDVRSATACVIEASTDAPYGLG